MNVFKKKGKEIRNCFDGFRIFRTGCFESLTLDLESILEIAGRDELHTCLGWCSRRNVHSDPLVDDLTCTSTTVMAVFEKR